jgi:hypothetical protein
MPTPARLSAPPPRLTIPTASDPPPGPGLWARLPADKRRQLRDLLGRLLARLPEARRLGEDGHE